MQPVKTRHIRRNHLRVSILIRPEGRMQPPTWLARTPRPLLFQSSSGQKAGCNQSAVGLIPDRIVQVSILIRPEGRMQPWRSWTACGPASVSILIRPSGRMQRGVVGLDAWLLDVSILIRPEGRMQPPWPATRTPGRGFQSSSGQKAGCNVRFSSPRTAAAVFQSSSGQKAGCNAAEGAGLAAEHVVSILIRPEGRMQPPESTHPGNAGP